MLEGINSKLDNFSLAVKKQIMFNKKIESQNTHLASTLSTTTMNRLKEYLLEELRLHVIHPTQKGDVDLHIQYR